MRSSKHFNRFHVFLDGQRIAEFNEFCFCGTFLESLIESKSELSQIYFIDHDKSHDLVIGGRRVVAMLRATYREELINRTDSLLEQYEKADASATEETSSTEKVGSRRDATTQRKGKNKEKVGEQ